MPSMTEQQQNPVYVFLQIYYRQFRYGSCKKTWISHRVVEWLIHEKHQVDFYEISGFFLICGLKINVASGGILKTMEQGF